MSQLLGGLAPQAWDQLAQNAFYSSERWLRNCASTPGVLSGAATVQVGEEVAAVPMSVFTAKVPPPYDCAALLRDRGLPQLPGPTVLVGPSLGYQTHLLRSSDDPALLSALLPEITRVGVELTGEPRPSCVAMFLSTQDVQALTAAGVRTPAVLLEPDAWFDLRDGGWDAWLAGLRKGQRYRVRDDVRRFGEHAYAVRHVSLSSCLDRLPPLAVELAKKLGFNADPARFHTEFSKLMEFTGDAARVALCEREDGVLIGFAIYYCWGTTVYLRFAALDYPKTDSSGAEYFNTSYYELIKLAGDRGLTQVHLGKKVLDAKVFRGARLRPLWLMDLSADSPLLAEADLVRKHNAQILADLVADPRMVHAIDNVAVWKSFC